MRLQKVRPICAVVLQTQGQFFEVNDGCQLIRIHLPGFLSFLSNFRSFAPTFFGYFEILWQSHIPVNLLYTTRPAVYTLPVLPHLSMILLRNDLSTESCRESLRFWQVSDCL